MEIITLNCSVASFSPILFLWLLSLNFFSFLALFLLLFLYHHQCFFFCILYGQWTWPNSRRTAHHHREGMAGFFLLFFFAAHFLQSSWKKKLFFYFPCLCLWPILTKKNDFNFHWKWTMVSHVAGFEIRKDQPTKKGRKIKGKT